MKSAIAILLLAMTPLFAFATEYHVATTGKDANPGTKEQPLRTIQRAADLAQPGDVITVHEGIYRERITPPRGGESDDKRIVYQAATGEKVEIKGSEPVTKWEKVQGDTWKATLPNSFFGEFNPYSDLIRGDWFSPKGREHHTGAVYLNGQWLIEAAKFDDVLKPAGAVSYGRGKSGVLLNVAWLRPGKGEGAAGRIAADKTTARQGPRNAPCTEGGQCIGWIEDGHWVKYEKVDFGKDAQSMEIRAASQTGGGRIELRLDSPEGDLLGTCTVENTGDWQKWVSFHAKIKATSGVKTLCLVFRSPASTKTGDTTSLWFGKVEKDTTTIWAQFPGVDPNTQPVEINVRQTVFTPDKPGINYITVRGFVMRHAATNWAPPTAGQIGLVSAYWCKGWIIEDNTISHSVCSGVALGKHGDKYDNTSANTAEGYVKTIERAQAFAIPWTRDAVGHHIVRNNHISHCEQTGIVGSMGCAFSTIAGNTIHDIHVRALFSGAEMAGIKFHGAIDVTLSNNHIYRTCRGIWLDWMGQGARISANLLHDNPGQDIFLEVDHGPILIDNNILLSPQTLLSQSQGIAFVHNLIGGGFHMIPHDNRKTPYHKNHSTEVAALHDNTCGDFRYYNNLFVQRGDATPLDNAKLPPVTMEGNVYLKGTKPSKHEKAPLCKPDFDPAVRLVEKEDGWYLEVNFDRAWSEGASRKFVTTELLGKALVPNLSFENPDGTALKVDADYFGKPRSADNPTPGPFENPGKGPLTLKRK